MIQVRFLRHTESIWSDVGHSFILGWGRTASRWSAPSPGMRTPREDDVLPHRPQMSSGRLFLDRVARQHCPSPLRRHEQNTMSSLKLGGKEDISTLPESGHFYFALTLATLPCQLCP
jgi:hypothetical protein